MLPLVSDELLHTLTKLVEQELPNEAVGLILVCQSGLNHVLPVINRSHSPQDSFMVKTLDILDAIEAAGLTKESIIWGDSVLWHSHPGGVIGPSRVDMRQKLEGIRHLVLSYDASTKTTTPTYY